MKKTLKQQIDDWINAKPKEVKITGVNIEKITDSVRKIGTYVPEFVDCGYTGEIHFRIGEDVKRVIELNH